MIEVKSIRFLGYNKSNHLVSVLLLTDDNEGLEANILIGLPEVMTRETIEFIMEINSAVAKTHGDEHEIDIQKIKRDKMDEFYTHVTSYVLDGKNKANVQIPLSDEVDEETLD